MIMSTKVCHDCGCEYIQWGQAWDDIYCRTCHTKHFARSPRALCPICQEKKLYLEFGHGHHGYALRRDGLNIYLYCRPCEKAFLALPASQQAFYIRSRCDLAFPRGQVIYGLVDSEVRYVGRTHDQKKRMQKHLKDRCEGTTDVGNGPYYGKANWMRDLLLMDN